MNTTQTPQQGSHVFLTLFRFPDPNTSSGTREHIAGVFLTESECEVIGNDYEASDNHVWWYSIPVEPTDHIAKQGETLFIYHPDREESQDVNGHWFIDVPGMDAPVVAFYDEASARKHPPRNASSDPLLQKVTIGSFNPEGPLGEYVALS